jgi:hypothetical protein
MKIIRTIWGEIQHTIKEVSNKFKFDNEIVYVWGSENNNYLKSIGYETYLISEDKSDERYSNQLKKYIHKLLVIEYADNMYDEYILLDWDSRIILNLDDEFTKLLRSKGTIQCPLYCLPNNFLEVINKENLSDEMSEYFFQQNEFIQKYSWKFDNLNVIPNFSFFYSNGAKIGKELIDIVIKHDIKTNVEEFALYIWANCNLNEWIDNFEPIVSIGQQIDTLKEVSDGLNIINKHISSILDKKIYISHKNDIKIIRVLWGSSEYILNEIPKVPLFDDELVYVWGIENQKYLISLGYDTVLMGLDITEFIFSTHLLHFQHKLFALQRAEENFKEFLFLDWDISLSKEIDYKFYELIRSGNNIQCPLYAYHKNYKEDIKKFLLENNTYSDNMDDFLHHHIKNLYKYNWEINDALALPCFGFFYSNDVNVFSELMKISNEYGLTACIEEFAMWIYSNCTLDEYISKYEPIVIRGKEKDKNLDDMTVAIKKINSYIDTKIKKDIYLLHDIN